MVYLEIRLHYLDFAIEKLASNNWISKYTMCVTGVNWKGKFLRACSSLIWGKHNSWENPVKLRMLSLNELDGLAFACIVWRLLTLPKCLSHSPEGWNSDESQAASRALRLKPSSARTQTDAKIRIIYDLNRPQASSRINIRVGHCWSGTKSRCIFHLVQILSQQSNESY